MTDASGDRPDRGALSGDATSAVQARSAHEQASESPQAAGRPAIVRRPLADQIKEHLLEGILSGRYPLDSRLVELQVARQLGTSEAPVREALRGLEALGLVEISPFRGARVRRPTPDEVLEAYAVRSELECLGLRLALPRLGPDDIDELAGYVSEMHRAAAAGDAHEVAAADASFHWRIIELSGNVALGRVWRTLEPFSRTLLTLVMPGADPEWTAGLHDPILESVRRGDVPGASAALVDHFGEAERLAARLWTDARPADGGRVPGRGPAGRKSTGAGPE